jgi:deoxyribonuclease-2
MPISALNDSHGNHVDWWFVYKLPHGIGPHQQTTGDEFLYCDASWNSELHISDNKLNDTKNAVTQTLKQIFSGDAATGYVLWNDEIPPTRSDPKPTNNHAKGHSKGVLAFNSKTDSGFYLLHSTPRFPAIGEIELPDDEREYGQTFLCVTLNYATTVQIAEILRLHHEPQVYASKNLPADASSPLVKLAQHDHRHTKSKPSLFADYKFRSKDRNEFRLFAKNKKWSEPGNGNGRGKDFWNHLVGPALRDNIDVETWRRGEVFANVDPDSNNVTLDVLGVNLQSIGYHGYQWPFTKDHAKWGSTVHRPPGFLFRHPGFVVIADINRDETQAKRGGGGLAFQHDGIWQALRSVEHVETMIAKTSHRSVKAA